VADTPTGRWQMNRLDILARLNGRLLRTFSARTLSTLREYLPVRLVLPHVEPILAANVHKEIEKDRLVITRAALRGDTDEPGNDELGMLFEATRAIDQRFLDQLRRLPVGLEIDYGIVRPIRTQRFVVLLEAAREVLRMWDEHERLRAALQRRFSSGDLKQLLNRLLSLYAEETHALSRAVQLPVLLAPARDLFADKLLEVMRRHGDALARDAATVVFQARPTRR